MHELTQLELEEARMSGSLHSREYYWLQFNNKNVRKIQSVNDMAREQLTNCERTDHRGCISVTELHSEYIWVARGSRPSNPK